MKLTTSEARCLIAWWDRLPPFTDCSGTHPEAAEREAERQAALRRAEAEDPAGT